MKEQGTRSFARPRSRRMSRSMASEKGGSAFLKENSRVRCLTRLHHLTYRTLGLMPNHSFPLTPLRGAASTAMQEITPGWKIVAIVAEGDSVLIQGQSPWALSWLGTAEAPITVAHPSYPAQRHRMQVYDLAASRAVRFAAGEFSNGVWGFYVPAAPTAARCSAGADQGIST